MVKKRIYIGDIRKCTGRESKTLVICESAGVIDKIGCWDWKSEIVKKNAILLKVCKDKYIDFDYFNCCKDYFDIITCINTKSFLDNVILDTFGSHFDGLFVDPDSLISIDSYEDIPDKIPNKAIVKSVIKEKAKEEKNKKLVKRKTKKQTI